ncbi:MAG TPA: hypothetical protein VE988_27060 [Gemmataceae bacterium]|nr:hypothetical protein [Gemmataceae bacterium]
MRIYFFLAGFWFLAAAIVFAYPAGRQYTILNSDWSIGWLLLLFGTWQLLRGWMTRRAANSDSHYPDAHDRNPDQH